jgi:PAS domain S-box-containing protein
LFAGLLLLYFGRAAAVRAAEEAAREKDQTLSELCREISQRKHKEVELRKLSVAVEYNPAAIVITDIQGNIEYVNRKFTEVTGYKFEEALGQNPRILKSGHTSEEEYANLWHTILAGEQWRGEFQNRKKNGELYWEQAMIAPIKDSRGQVVNFVAVKEDITARKYAEEALTKSEERARLLLNSTAEGIYGIDLNGNCTFCNPACVRMLGYKHSADLLGADMHRKIHHSHANGAAYPIEECRIYRAFRLGQGAHVEDEVFWRADGSSFPVEYWSYPQRNEGKIVGAVVAFVDITQRRRNEAALQKAGRELAHTNRELQRASEVKSRFLANMSHEIRTPLNAVIGMAGLLADTPLNEQQKDYCETIRASGEMLLAVINDILDFSKIEADKMELDRQPFDPVQCVKDAMDIVGLRAREKGLELTFQPADDLPRSVLGDAVRLRQILVNLLNNAVKFTERGRVEASLAATRRDDGRHELQFAVSDTGPGIPHDQRDRLFQSFSQLDVSIQRRHGGTGLGLAISKRLCEMMGGRIWVESSGVPGKGATFRFTIVAEDAPITQPPTSSLIPENQNPSASLETPGRKKSLHILLAEDNPVNQKVARAMLGKLGHVADTASDGVEALEAVEKKLYDVVLMDCQMPRMDGYEATRKIRDLEKRLGRRPTRIIALTASALLGDRQKCIDAGMDAYLSKPVRPAELRQALENVAAESTTQPADAEKSVPVS